MRRVFVLLSLLLPLLPASAHAASDHWVQVQSEHFTVLTNADEKQGRHLAGQFERMRAVFHKLFPSATGDSGARLTVVALKDKRDFQALEPAEYLARNQLDLAGLFLRAPDKNYIMLRLDAGGDHPYATVYHEYTHLMLSKLDDWLPLWLNEGLAELYQNTTIQDKDVLLGQPSEFDILYLRQNRLIPLTTLLQVDHASPYYHEEQKGSVFYSESWALAHYLAMQDYEKKTTRVQDYGKRLAAHEDNLTAAREAFGDLTQLQRELSGYIGQGSFKMFRMNSGVTLDEKSLAVQPVSTSEVNSVRADIMTDNGRTTEAQALLDTTLRDDPENALAHEIMGFLRLREHDTAGARTWFGEAVQLDSHSYLAHYYYAMMTQQSGSSGHEAEIESSLRASIKLNPAFAPAYDALALFYGEHQEQLDEAHRLNATAIQLDPGDLNYRLNAATVLMQAQQLAKALSVLQAARRVAKTPDDIARVQARIDSLQKYQAAVDAALKTPGNVTAQPNTPAQSGAKGVILVSSNIAVEAPKYPAGAPTGPHHTARGVIRSVHCYYPSILTLTIEQPGNTVSLYHNDFFKIDFTAANFTPEKDVDPCHDIEGMKARIAYAEVSDKTINGQIVSVELTK